MKEFLLALIEVIIIILFPINVWLIIKFSNYIHFIYPLFIINISILHFLRSYFLEILTLVLSIFLGIVIIFFIPRDFDKIIIGLEIMYLLCCYFILIQMDKEIEKQKALWLEKKENLEKENSLLVVSSEAAQNEIYNSVVKIKSYKLVEEIIKKFASLNDVSHLKKYVIETFKNLFPNSVTRIYFTNDEIKEYIDEYLIKHCSKEKGFLYIQDLQDFIIKSGNTQLKKYLKIQKSISSAICIQLATKLGSKEKNNGYLICYSVIPIPENDIRIILLLSYYIGVTISNIELFNYVKELSITDTLTGLYVQKYFKELLLEEIKISSHYKIPLSLAIFDIDNFKLVNDKYSHNVGDEVLIKFANILKTRLRETDILARYGGDEFAVIFLDTNKEDAFKICEGIRKIVEDEIIVLPKEKLSKKVSVSPRIKFSVSCGVDEYSEKFENMNKFLSYVDHLLYKAKTTGKNKVVSCSC